MNIGKYSPNPFTPQKNQRNTMGGNKSKNFGNTQPVEPDIMFSARFGRNNDSHKHNHTHYNNNHNQHNDHNNHHHHNNNSPLNIKKILSKTHSPTMSQSSKSKSGVKQQHQQQQQQQQQQQWGGSSVHSQQKNGHPLSSTVSKGTTSTSKHTPLTTRHPVSASTRKSITTAKHKPHDNRHDKAGGFKLVQLEKLKKNENIITNLEKENKILRQMLAESEKNIERIQQQAKELQLLANRKVQSKGPMEHKQNTVVKRDEHKQSTVGCECAELRKREQQEEQRALYDLEKKIKYMEMLAGRLETFEQAHSTPPLQDYLYIQTRSQAPSLTQQTPPLTIINLLLS